MENKQKLQENPLLNINQRVSYDLIKSEDIEPALIKVLENSNKIIKNIKIIQENNWQNTVEKLTDAIEQVSKVWTIVGHINSVLSTKEWRDEYNKMLRKITVFFDSIYQDCELYNKIEKITSSETYNSLSQAQKTRLQNELREFVLHGAKLGKKERTRLTEINNRLAEVSSKFSQNVLDSTDKFELTINVSEDLEGLSEEELAMFKDGDVYKIGLQMPHYLAIMKHAKNRDLRKKIHYAYSTRASELANEGKFDNHILINEILALKDEKAKLLGYDSYAQLSLVKKMADTPLNVIKFIKDIIIKAKEFANKDINDLNFFAQEKFQINKLEPWDIFYLSEKLRENNYAYSNEELKTYFPLNQVLKGLFELIEELYGIDIKEKKVPVWHEDVKYFILINKDDVEIGGIYMDLFARKAKRSGAWMNSYQGRRKNLETQKIENPIAYLICNFTPLKDKQSYLTHNEIITLFHEMGHSLHHLLTTVDDVGVSGIAGVPWDAVELPSQFMENFAWNYDILKNMSLHKDTKEKLPLGLFNKLIKAKNFQSGLFILRQMEFALFDMEIFNHQSQVCDWQEILNQIRKDTSLVSVPSYCRFPNSFNHIFAGGYSAGYYSYIWAQVLAVDVYSIFEKNLNNLSQIGKKFLDEILSVGGSRDFNISFKSFMGREANIDSLFKYYGLN